MSRCFDRSSTCGYEKLPPACVPTRRWSEINPDGSRTGSGRSSKRVDHAEHRGIGADAERERQHRYDGEAAVAMEAAPAVANDPA